MADDTQSGGTPTDRRFIRASDLGQFGFCREAARLNLLGVEQTEDAKAKMAAGAAALAEPSAAEVPAESPTSSTGHRWKQFAARGFRLVIVCALIALMAAVYWANFGRQWSL